jgi:hypothetical protein
METSGVRRGRRRATLNGVVDLSSSLPEGAGSGRERRIWEGEAPCSVGRSSTRVERERRRCRRRRWRARERARPRPRRRGQLRARDRRAWPPALRGERSGARRAERRAVLGWDREGGATLGGVRGGAALDGEREGGAALGGEREEEGRRSVEIWVCCWSTVVLGALFVHCSRPKRVK